MHNEGQSRVQINPIIIHFVLFFTTEFDRRPFFRSKWALGLPHSGKTAITPKQIFPGKRTGQKPNV